MKLTQIQERALNKLTKEFQCAYELQESINTLRVLVNLGLAEHKQSIGVLFAPRIANSYRRKQ